MDLSHKRKEYTLATIDIDSLVSSPFEQFQFWFQEANDRDLLEPNAMTLATVDSANKPSLRTVLLKYYDKTGFVFFTNYQSRKGKQIEQNQHVAVLFQWLQLQRQVEINGYAEKISASESLKYFSLRPRGSQLGAWVSNQSMVVSTRSVLQNQLSGFKEIFATGSIPMPPAWGGYRIVPDRFEFWQGGVNRLHDRIEYRLYDHLNSWERQRLSP